MPFDSYIKPQRSFVRSSKILSCMPFDSYIKPQLSNGTCQRTFVVCLLIPTSNHNLDYGIQENAWLYAFWFLHQTTTKRPNIGKTATLYAFWFLHQTTTRVIYDICRVGCMPFDSYIKPQHVPDSPKYVLRCMPFDSYIKPQQNKWLYIRSLGCMPFDSYIKPQPYIHHNQLLLCCMPFDSYIKPQLTNDACIVITVVCLLIPTSNHNPYTKWYKCLFVVCLLIPTSNHNLFQIKSITLQVVCLLIPTSNHNLHIVVKPYSVLYAFWFLHQTTT